MELFEGQLPLLQWGEGAAELGQLPFQLAAGSDPIGQLLAPCLQPSFYLLAAQACLAALVPQCIQPAFQAFPLVWQPLLLGDGLAQLPMALEMAQQALSPGFEGADLLAEPAPGDGASCLAQAGQFPLQLLALPGNLLSRLAAADPGLLLQVEQGLGTGLQRFGCLQVCLAPTRADSQPHAAADAELGGAAELQGFTRQEWLAPYRHRLVGIEQGNGGGHCLAAGLGLGQLLFRLSEGPDRFLIDRCQLQQTLLALLGIPLKLLELLLVSVQLPGFLLKAGEVEQLLGQLKPPCQLPLLAIELQQGQLPSSAAGLVGGLLLQQAGQLLLPGLLLGLQVETLLLEGLLLSQGQLQLGKLLLQGADLGLAQAELARQLAGPPQPGPFRRVDGLQPCADPLQLLHGRFQLSPVALGLFQGCLGLLAALPRLGQGGAGLDLARGGELQIQPGLQLLPHQPIQGRFQGRCGPPLL